MSTPLTVYYDGACPLCRREIDFYRHRRGAERVAWVDVSAAAEDRLAPGLCRTDALARFHVRTADGHLVSGARAFAALWAGLPQFRWLGRIAGTSLALPVLEVAYRRFLRWRPAMQRLAARGDAAAASECPRWLERELRSDHAGETGAVAIYRGILAASRDDAVRAFARRHVATESRHLAIMDALLTPARRSRLLLLWRAAGFVTGALPALFGARAVYATVDAVESFVDRHYGAQIDALAGEARWDALRASLETCRDDELEHRDEARANVAGALPLALRLWTACVDLGSRAGVAIARRL